MICKHCAKYFIAQHGTELYCSTRCRKFVKNWRANEAVKAKYVPAPGLIAVVPLDIYAEQLKAVTGDGARYLQGEINLNQLISINENLYRTL